MTELTAQERAALALWLLMQEPATTAEIAGRCDLSWSGARRMLTKIGRVVPIFQVDGLWMVEECQASQHNGAG